MQCQDCQFDNPDGAKFCNECGSAQADCCPSCNNLNPPASKFCGECGYQLQVEPGKDEAPHVELSKPRSYTPKHLADKILTSRSAIEGERKQVTVLFADVANFTALSEKLDPEEVHLIMDGCFKILMAEIHKYEGTINQFTGDGVMAIFGAPIAHENHAKNACDAALAILAAIKPYGEKVHRECNVLFKIRMGINSGPVIVGSIGDDLRMDYTAVGDTTNLAARLESKAQHNTVLISDNTRRIVQNYFNLESIGKLDLKGKTGLHEGFRLIKRGNIETRMGASIAKGLTKFIGRKNSIARLMEIYGRVKEGHGQVIGIVGEPGVGKSRVLHEFKKRISADGITYLEGRCMQYGGNTIYKPIIDILRAYFQIKDDDRAYLVKRKIKEKCGQLSESGDEVLSAIYDLLSIEVRNQEYLKLGPDQKRLFIFESMRNLFVKESESAPLIFVVEDLHWIDKSSENFIDYFIKWLANAKVMVVLLYRPEYVHQWGSLSYYTKLGLTQLGEQSSLELLQAILRDGAILNELVNLILSHASGNPLFIEELTHTLLDKGAIVYRDDQYIAASKIGEIDIPETIEGIIAARLDRLEDNLKKTLQVASVIGRDFAFRILKLITEFKDEVKSYLFTLQGLEFIYEKKLFPELEYIFKHALTQEVAYKSLLINRRKEIHENIGKAIEDIYAERLPEYFEALSYHYYQSSNLEKCIEYSQKAAKKAQRSASFQEAIYQTKMRLACLEKMQRTQKVQKKIIDTRITLSRFYTSLSQNSDAKKVLDPIIDIVHELKYEKRYASIYFILGTYLLTVEEKINESIEYFNKAIIYAEKHSDLISLWLANYNLGLAYALNLRYSEAEKLFKNCIDYSVIAGRTTGVIYGKTTLGAYCLTAEGKIDEACALSQECMMEIRESANSFLNAPVLTNHGMAQFFKGEILDAEKHLVKGMRYSIDTNNIHWIGWSCCFLSYINLLKKDYLTAQNYIKKGIGHLSLYNLGKMRDWFLVSFKITNALKDNSRHHLLEAVGIYGKINSKILRSIFSAQIVMGFIKLDCFDDAFRWLRKSRSLHEKAGMKWYLAQDYNMYSVLYKKLNKADKSSEYLTKAAVLFEKCGADGWVKILTRNS